MKYRTCVRRMDRYGKCCHLLLIRTNLCVCIFLFAISNMACLHLPLSFGILVFWCFGLFDLFDLFDLMDLLDLLDLLDLFDLLDLLCILKTYLFRNELIRQRKDKGGWG